MTFAFLPESARPHERSVLILYHLLGLTDANEIREALGRRDKSRIYRTLSKYRGKIDLSLVESAKMSIDADGRRPSLIDLYPRV